MITDAEIAKIALPTQEDFSRLWDRMHAAEAESATRKKIVAGVVEWAKTAYRWQGFWDDMNWRPKSNFDENGKVLRDFIKECEAEIDAAQGEVQQ